VLTKNLSWIIIIGEENICWELREFMTNAVANNITNNTLVQSVKSANPHAAAAGISFNQMYMQELMRASTSTAPLSSSPQTVNSQAVNDTPVVNTSMASSQVANAAPVASSQASGVPRAASAFGLVTETVASDFDGFVSTGFGGSMRVGANGQVEFSSFVPGLHTFVTEADLVNAGYDMSILRANALFFNPMSMVTSCGRIPLLVVPHSITGEFDFTRDVATSEMLGRTFESNASFGFGVDMGSVSTAPISVQVSDTAFASAGIDVNTLVADASNMPAPLYAIPYGINSTVSPVGAGSVLSSSVLPFDTNVNFEYTNAVADSSSFAENSVFGFRVQDSNDNEV